MDKVAKVFVSGNSQAVRLPQEFRFSCNEVYVTRRGNEVILTPRPTTWNGFMEGVGPLSDDFAVDDAPLAKDVERARLI